MINCKKRRVSPVISRWRCCCAPTTCTKLAPPNAASKLPLRRLGAQEALLTRASQLFQLGDYAHAQGLAVRAHEQGLQSKLLTGWLDSDLCDSCCRR